VRTETPRGSPCEGEGSGPSVYIQRDLADEFRQRAGGGSGLKLQLGKPVPSHGVSETPHCILDAFCEDVRDPPVVVDDVNFAIEAGNVVRDLLWECRTPQTRPDAASGVQERPQGGERSD